LPPALWMLAATLLAFAVEFGANRFPRIFAAGLTWRAVLGHTVNCRPCVLSDYPPGRLLFYRKSNPRRLLNCRLPPILFQKVLTLGVQLSTVQDVGGFRIATIVGQHNEDAVKGIPLVFVGFFGHPIFTPVGVSLQPEDDRRDVARFGSGE